MRQLNDWIDAYLDYTENTEPKRIYRLWVAISTIASALRRKCYIQWGAETWYPNFYIILVGPPAARKGTALKPGLELLEGIGIKVAADETSRERLIDQMSRLRDQDSPLYFHTSITIVASELTVFLRERDLMMLATLCKWFDCEHSFTYDTLGRGLQEIPNVWVNLLGATTPELLQSSLPFESFGGGFISRTIFVYADDIEKVVIFPELDDLIGGKLKRDLENIHSLRGEFKLSTPMEGEKDFISFYRDWRYAQIDNPPVRDARLSKYNARQPMHLLKLCMILAASRSDDMIITPADLERAKRILGEMEPGYSLAFQGVGLNPLAGTQEQIRKFIISAEELPISNIIALYKNDISRTQLTEILGTLAASGDIGLDPVNGLALSPKELKRRRSEG